MSKNVRLTTFDPRKVYEVIEGTASGIPFRFLAEDSRTFLLYPHIWELLTRWRMEGKVRVIVYDEQTEDRLGLGILEKTS
jgi:hypothetical protein